MGEVVVFNVFPSVDNLSNVGGENQVVLREPLFPYKNIVYGVSRISIIRYRNYGPVPNIIDKIVCPFWNDELKIVEIVQNIIIWINGPRISCFGLLGNAIELLETVSVNVEIIVCIQVFYILNVEQVQMISSGCARFPAVMYNAVYGLSIESDIILQACPCAYGSGRRHVFRDQPFGFNGKHNPWYRQFDITTKF